jgi:Protein of unknown function (DUF2934)
MFTKAGGMAQSLNGPKREQCNRFIGRPVANHRPPPFLNDIGDLAYDKWVAAGMPPGDSVRFWLEAEQELCAGR